MHYITNVLLPCPLTNHDSETEWRILVNDSDVIVSIESNTKVSSLLSESWEGDWLSPMGIDLQINGGMGISFNEILSSDIPKLLNLLDQLWCDGIEAIAPTIVTCSVDALRESLLVFREARSKISSNQCNLLGAHLEGPFISKEKIGAHSLNHICSPSLEALENRIKGFDQEIALVTLAPELTNSKEIISKLKSLGIIISLGHSTADLEITNKSFDQGVKMLTHTFNAMPDLLHRSPGPIAAAIENGNIYLGLIADGIHVHPNMMRLLLKLASGKIVLVSDALAPYGLQDREYKWDTRKLFVKDRSCFLENGALAGTTLPLLESTCRFAACTEEPSNAIWSSTVSPRQLLEEGFNLNEFLIGQPLKNLLRWHFNHEELTLKWQKAS